jgi:hypothetical protein
VVLKGPYTFTQLSRRDGCRQRFSITGGDDRGFLLIRGRIVVTVNDEFREIGCLSDMSEFKCRINTRILTYTLKDSLRCRHGRKAEDRRSTN